MYNYVNTTSFYVFMLRLRKALRSHSWFFHIDDVLVLKLGLPCDAEIILWPGVKARIDVVDPKIVRTQTLSEV